MELITRGMTTRTDFPTCTVYAHVSRNISSSGSNGVISRAITLPLPKLRCSRRSDTELFCWLPTLMRVTVWHPTLFRSDRQWSIFLVWRSVF